MLGDKCPGSIIDLGEKFDIQKDGDIYFVDIPR